jgi:hypothetical protein
MVKAQRQKHRERADSISLAKKSKIVIARDSSSFTPLNFKVPAEFHREFKTYAAQRGISMLELLQEGFRLVKERRGE